jgi:hypothetical protein
MNSTALQLKFPKKLNTYNKKNRFWIFVNEEFDRFLDAYKKAKDLKESKQWNALCIEKGLGTSKYLHIYTDRTLKLAVVSTGNDNTSREITIGSDIKETALNEHYFDREYLQCMELYKYFGLICNVNDIKIRTDKDENKGIPNEWDVNKLIDVRSKLKRKN